MNRFLARGRVGGIAALLLTGCGGSGADTHEADDTPLAESGTLTLGSRGEAVRDLHSYLREHGYLPNEEVQRQFPSWRSPVADGPAKDDVYDGSTVQAVLSLQRAFGFEETGEVDARTKAFVLQPRCGVPEIEPIDARAKWDIGTNTVLFLPTDITWKVIDPSLCGITQAEADAAVAAGLSQWANPTPYTFTQVAANAAAKIEIRCSSTNPNGNPWSGNTLASTYYPSNGSDVWMNSNIAWSATTPATAGRYDFRSVVSHELGHSIGLAHSSVATNALMYPTIGAGEEHRYAQYDDNAAGLALGVIWRRFDTTSYDIDADSFAGAKKMFVVADPPISGGFSVFRRQNGAWTEFPGQGGVRIASNANVPWIVQDDGDIYQWVTNQWVQRPGCAKDIAVGYDDSVWIVSCSVQFRADGGAPRGYQVRKWNGASFVTITGGEGAWRISAGPKPTSPYGEIVPWIVNQNGGIYRRSSSNPSSGTYEQLPDTANDIGVSAHGTAWIIGTTAGSGGYDIRVWNEQAALGSGSPNPVARARWVTVEGHAINISADDSGFPVLVNNVKRAYDNQ